MPHLDIEKLRLADGQRPLVEDKRLGFYLYQLPNALAPGARLALDFALTYANVGFANSRPNTDIVQNGTLLGDRYLPYAGYAKDIELTDDGVRHRHGLVGVKRLPKLDDLAARQVNAASN